MNALSLDESCQSTRKTIYTMKKDQIHPQWVLQVPFHQGIKQVLYESQTWIQANFGMVSRSGYCMTFNMVASWIRKRKKISKYWMWKSQSQKITFFMLILLFLNDFIALEHLDFKRTPRNISEYMYIFDSQYFLSLRCALCLRDHAASFLQVCGMIFWTDYFWVLGEAYK